MVNALELAQRYSAPLYRDLVGRPPRSVKEPLGCARGAGATQGQPRCAQLIMPLSLFIAYAFTVFDAGFALKTRGSFVKPSWTYALISRQKSDERGLKRPS